MIKIKVSKKELNIFNFNWWKNTKSEWAPKLLLENRKNWPNEVGYDGKPWKALTPGYAKWKSENYGSLPILRLSGKMLDRASVEVRGNKFLVYGSSIGLYHQFGTRKMVSRPWMGVPNQALAILEEISLKHILK